jgi:hypothetical protein
MCFSRGVTLQNSLFQRIAHNEKSIDKYTKIQPLSMRKF